MNNPRELLAQIQRRQAHAAAVRREPRVPAPAPIRPIGEAGVARPSLDVPQTDAVPAPQARDRVPAQPAPILPRSDRAPAPAPVPAAPPTPQRPTTARPAGSHALYSQIMKRHDRMGTRHL